MTSRSSATIRNELCSQVLVENIAPRCKLFWYDRRYVIFAKRKLVRCRYYSLIGANPTARPCKTCTN